MLQEGLDAASKQMETLPGYDKGAAEVGRTMLGLYEVQIAVRSERQAGSSTSFCETMSYLQKVQDGEGICECSTPEPALDCGADCFGHGETILNSLRSRS
jgi:hypothetical protein